MQRNYRERQKGKAQGVLDPSDPMIGGQGDANSASRTEDLAGVDGEGKIHRVDPKFAS